MGNFIDWWREKNVIKYWRQRVVTFVVLHGAVGAWGLWMALMNPSPLRFKLSVFIMLLSALGLLLDYRQWRSWSDVEKGWASLKGVFPPVLGEETLCPCASCFKARHPNQNDPLAYGRLFLCEFCGNKRCPHASNHRNACTESNEPGQPGSSYV